MYKFDHPILTEALRQHGIPLARNVAGFADSVPILKRALERKTDVSLLSLVKEFLPNSSFEGKDCLFVSSRVLRDCIRLSVALYVSPSVTLYFFSSKGDLTSITPAQHMPLMMSCSWPRSIMSKPVS